MTEKQRRFEFSLEKTVLAAMAAAICFALAYWQYTRWVGKKQYFARLHKQDARGVQTLPQDPNWEALYQARVRLEGEFIHDLDMVIINRSMNDRPGVKLITPLEIHGRNSLILVDRGFIPYDDSAREARAKYHGTGPVTLEGRLRPPQKRQFPIGLPQAPVQGWRDRWHRVDVKAMAGQIGGKVVPAYLEQTNQPQGHPAHLARAVVSPLRHLNYTIQWTSFGSFSLLLGFFLQYRKAKGNVPGKDTGD